MVENFEQKNRQPEGPEQPEQVEGRAEQPEAGIKTLDQLTNLADEVRADIDRTSGEAVTDANEAVESSLAEYVGESSEGDKVKKVKQELAGIKSKIEQLAQKSSEEVEEIISGDDNVDATSAEPEVTIGSIESEDDFEKALEGEIYPALGISIGDEKAYREKIDYSDKHEALEGVDQVSFGNIRESVQMFVDYYSRQGVPYKKEHFDKEEEIEERLWDEFWKSEGGNTNDQGEPIDSKGRALRVTENMRGIIWPKRDKLMEEFPLEKKKIEVNELISKLQSEISRLKEQSAVTYNVRSQGDQPFGRAGKIFASGNLVPMTEQPEEVRKEMRKTGGMLGEIFGSDPKEYDERRQHSETIMGIHDSGDHHPVYGALAGGSDGSLEKGGAPQYGEIVLVFDDIIKDRTIFTEGDSMNPRGLRNFNHSKEKLSEKNGLKHRQLNSEHAGIAKALYNISEELDEPFYGKDADNRMKYIEAQILGGVSMDDVREIIINDYEFEGEINDWKKEYPQYAELFRLAK